MNLAVVAQLGLIWLAPARGEAAQSPRPQGEPALRFVEANAAFEAGDYGRAASLYESLVSERFDDGRVSYNLGNAWLRLGRIGEAIACFRRALYQHPRDADIKANLAFARKSAKDAVAPVEPSPVGQTLFFWHYSLSRRELGWAALIANGLLWVCLAIRLFRRSDVLGWVAAFAALALLCSSGSLLVRHFLPTRIAVIAVPETNIYSGTSTDSVVRFVLHEGTEAAWLDSDSNWARIMLADGKQGWVSAANVATVDHG